MPKISPIQIYYALLGIILCLFSYLTITRFCGAGRDDIFITLWVGKMLPESGWFINYNGDYQEMSSTMLGAFFGWLSHLFNTDAPVSSALYPKRLR
jgi:hypothetical protein